MRRTIPETKMADLEKNYLPVESDFFDHVIYAVDRRGKGMHIIVGNRSIPVAAENIEPFAAEIIAVWDSMRPRMVK